MGRRAASADIAIVCNFCRSPLGFDGKFTAISQMSAQSIRATLSVLPSRLTAWVGHIAPDRQVGCHPCWILRLGIAVLAMEVELQADSGTGKGPFPVPKTQHFSKSTL